MDNQLRQLAYSITTTGSVKKDTISQFINSLSTSDLKKFLQYLRTAYAKSNIEVTTAEKSDIIAEYFKKNYKDKNISFRTDSSIKGGVIVKIGDDMYDYSVKNYINTTIERLTNEL